jgi:microsomal prostaglandin-E synthase 1
MSHNPAFLIYTVSMVILCLNILGLWGYSGSVRAKEKVTLNDEDIRTVSKDAALGPDSPGVARVLRAHRNAADNILPFGILGLLFVLWGGSPLLTGIFCGIFVLARLLHTWAYLGAKQPLRTISFVAGGLSTLVMVLFLVKQLISAA